jgi:hypothetical protein
MTRGKELAMTLPLVVARHNSAEAISSRARDCFASLAMTKERRLKMTPLFAFIRVKD